MNLYNLGYLLSFLGMCLGLFVHISISFMFVVMGVIVLMLEGDKK